MPSLPTPVAPSAPTLGQDQDLAQLRARIDALDDDLLALLNARARLVEDVGRAKAGLGVEGAYFVPGRERAILQRLQSANPGPFPSGALTHVFQEIFSACLSLEKGLRVAYLGPEGTFSHLAVLRRFGRSAQALPVGTLEGVLERVSRGEADLAVVPVENATEGLVGPTLDAVMAAPPRLSGELLLEVDHVLATAPATDLGSVAVVHSHPQALGQCRQWLAAHLPGAALREAPSTAEAARRAAEDPRAAAVASALAASLNGLQVRHRRIQDHPLNQTRFWVVGGPAPAPTGEDRTSLLVPGGQGPGTLLRLLRPFADRGLDLTRIESRPSRQTPWTHAFFLELDGHSEDAPVAAALAELRLAAPGVAVLGAYPKATTALPGVLPEESLP